MAAATHDLEYFVRHALAKGVSRLDIETALAAAGWPAEQSRDALEAYADIAFPVPVPLAESSRWSTASVIIAFPIFLYVARYLGRAIDRSKRAAAARNSARE